ncbi:MAG: hypothetical protein ACREF8_06490, partial [Chthoniobacterales bacterium]
MEAKPMSHDSNEKTGKRRTGDSIRRGLVFAGLMLAVSLAAKYATARGAIHAHDLSLRLVMAIAGVFLVSTGNMIPKTLTPLSAMRCGATKVPSFQRLAGWTWVLAGLALAIGWLVLPVARAEQM